MSVKMNIDGTLVPISGNLYHNEMFAGQITMGANTTAPFGWLLCDGAAVSKNDYPALYAAIGDTYNKPDTPATQFCVPDMRGRYALGAAATGDEILGKKIDESLPNIKGKFSHFSSEFATPQPYYGSGCFSQTTFGDNTTSIKVVNDKAPLTACSFDASQTSSGNGDAYKDGAKVRPDSITLNYFIKY